MPDTETVMSGGGKRVVYSPFETRSYRHYPAKSEVMMKKCNDCEELYALIDRGKASMMPSKCYPKGGEPCPYLSMPSYEWKNIENHVSGTQSTENVDK